MIDKEPHLDSSLSLRPVQWTDLSAVVQLIYDVCEADGDITLATTAEDLANVWKNEGYSVERDAFLVETQDGYVVGYEEFFHAKDQYHDLGADGYVHPEFKGMGIGTSLVTKIK